MHGTTGARFLLFLLWFFLPPTLIGWGIGGRLLALVVLASLILLFIILNLFLQSWIERIQLHGNRGVHVDGAETSLSQVLRQMGRRMGRSRCPRLVIYPDPVPNSLVARGLFGNGTILMSQGLIEALTEGELRAILRFSVLRMESAQTIIQSWCALLARAWIFLAPSQWLYLILASYPDRRGPATQTMSRWREYFSKVGRRLSAITAAWFLTVWPLAKIWLAIGGNQGSLSRPLPSQIGDYQGKHLEDAMQKVDQTLKRSPFSGQPALLGLYLFNPQLNAGLLPVFP